MRHALDERVHEDDALEAQLRRLREQPRLVQVGRRALLRGGVECVREQLVRLLRGELLAHLLALGRLDQRVEHAEVARVAQPRDEVHHRLGRVPVHVRHERLAVLRPVARRGGGAGQALLELHDGRHERVEELVGRGRQQVEEGEDGARDRDLVARLEGLRLGEAGVGVGCGRGCACGWEVHAHWAARDRAALVRGAGDEEWVGGVRWGWARGLGVRVAGSAPC